MSISWVGASAKAVVMRALGGNQLQLQKLKLVVVAMVYMSATRSRLAGSAYGGAGAGSGGAFDATGQPPDQLGHR